MYVCICYGVTEQDIQEAVKNGANSMRHLQAQLKLATCCGACADCAQNYLDKILARSLVTADVVTA